MNLGGSRKCERPGGIAEASALFIQLLLFRPSQGEKAGPRFTQLLFLKTQLSRLTQLPHSASVQEKIITTNSSKDYDPKIFHSDFSNFDFHFPLRFWGKAFNFYVLCTPGSRHFSVIFHNLYCSINYCGMQSKEKRGFEIRNAWFKGSVWRMKKKCIELV